MGWAGVPEMSGSTNTQTWIPTSAVALSIVLDRLVLVKSPVSTDGRMSRVVPLPFGVLTSEIREVSSVPPLRVAPVNAPAPTHTPLRPQTVPVGHCAFVVHAVVEVQMPAVHTGAPAGHCPLFVQSWALKTAGVAVQVAEVPVAVKLPLLLASAG